MEKRVRKDRRRPAHEASPLPPGGQIEPYFQPIVDLRRGRVSGFEALARLVVGDGVLSPAQFLGRIPPGDRLNLFQTMLDRSLAAIKRAVPRDADCYVSLNVERFLFLDEGFVTAVQETLAAQSYPGERLVLEILEDDRIEDEPAMIRCLERVRRLGVRVALDDIGTAHASLMNIKNLPIDVLKLDQTFARGLGERPQDLQFVLSILSLARGLDKSLVIEGVETPDILDALMILGVEYAQGYAIARPMPAHAVPDWLATYAVPIASRTPHTLLGAYGSHLTVLETCRILMCQPLPVSWKDESRNPHNCEIGRYFDRCGLHETGFGMAHKRFHEVMTCYGTDFPAWKQGAEGFGTALRAAIRDARNAAARPKE